MHGPPDIGSASDGPALRSGVGGTLWMIALAAVVGGVVGFRYLTQMRDPSFAAAEPAGTQGKKYVLLMFTADWCGPCQNFKASVLANPAVAARVEKSCPLVKVDLTQRGGPNTEVARQYNVRGIPCLVITDTAGREVARYGGPHDPRQFLRWVESNTK